MKGIRNTEREKQLLTKLLEHLESAQAITDELGQDTAGYLVERALDEVRTIQWPHTDPEPQVFKSRKK